MYTEQALDTPETLPGHRGGGMWSYTYKHGDRPLEGYTIERAAGRGGFGEVYYAVSDSGREVALKVITGFEQIELRGISQCMNLKSPHLVSIFDVRHNDQGRAFVIMEYVSGPNLRELLDESPAGLGPQKAAFFLREIGKGLSYLHDCGIVHRDLKPANIFFENGYAKIGDYGLSKAIAPTHHSGQTVTVGTVHYMAPEVGVGKYDRSIDIYALGALLYEMLTGMVPFVGASAGEILIKHLSHEPDVSGIAEPFAGAIRKAMAKDPAERFQTVQEMVEAVFGAEHVRNSVAEFSPQELSVIAGHVAARMARPGGGGTRHDVGGGKGGTAVAGSSVTNPRGLGSPGPSWTAAAGPGGRWGEAPASAVRRITSTLSAPLQEDPTHPEGHLPGTTPADSLSLRHRVALGIVAAVVVALAAQAFVGARDEMGAWLFTILGILGASAGIVITARRWLTRPQPRNEWADRIALAAAGALGGIALSAVIWMDSPEMGRGAGGTFFGILIALAVANPRAWTDSRRPERIRFMAAVFAGAVAFVAAGVFNGNPALAIAIAGGAALVVQVLVPWDERAATRKRREQPEMDDQEDEDDAAQAAAHWGAAGAQPADPNAQTRGPMMAAAWVPPAAAAPAWPGTRPVPRWLTIFWFCGLQLFFAIGIVLHVVAAVSRLSTSEFAAFVAGALVMDTLAVFCFLRMRRRVMTSWLEHLVLPSIRAACAATFIGCWAVWGLGRPSRSDEEDMAIVMFIAAMLWVLTWVMPWLWRVALGRAEWDNAGNGGAAVAAPMARMAAAPPPIPGATVSGAVAVGAVAPAPPGSPAPHSAPPPPPRPRRRRAPKPRAEHDIVGWLAAFVGAVLVFAAFALAVLLAGDLPGFLAAGLPDPSIRAQLQDDVFAGWSNWPSLFRGLMTGGMLVLLAAGLAGVIFARRRANGAHLIRGVVGVVGLFLALYPVFLAVVRGRLWDVVSRRRDEMVATHALDTALNRLMPGALLAFVILVVSMIVLFWPRRSGQVQRKGATT